MTAIPSGALRFVDTGGTPPPAQLDDLVDLWLSENAARGDPSVLSVADQIFSNLLRDGAVDLAWAFVRAATARAVNEWQITMLAAGPLEDLIARHGDAVIDRIEDLARRAPRFRHVLSGVWPQGRQDTETWHRIEQARAVNRPQGIDSAAAMPGPDGLE